MAVIWPSSGLKYRLGLMFVRMSRVNLTDERVKAKKLTKEVIDDYD